MTAEQFEVSETQPDFRAGAAYIDGAYCPIGEAKISILDWGLTRSDCTYDVVHVWKGRFFRLDRHLERFRRSIEKLRLSLPFEAGELAGFLNGCVKRTGLQDAFVSMTCTRGRALPGSRDPRDCTNTFYCYALPFVWIIPPEHHAQGLNMHVSSVLRVPPESVDPTVKNYHWIDLEMSLFEAYENDATVVVLKGTDGTVCEGAGYNVFALSGGRLVTPAHGVLQGITRRSVLDLCDELNVSAEEGVLSEDMLRGADELFITSTAGGIMPVTKLEGRNVGDGAPGPVTLRLRDLYWKKHDDPQWSSAVDYG